MKAILTKYLPFTNTKPARIKASAEGVGSFTHSVENLRTIGDVKDDPHITAAKLVCERFQWGTSLASGVLPDGSWAHCFVPDRSKEREALREIAKAGEETSTDIYTIREIAREALR